MVYDYLLFDAIKIDLTAFKVLIREDSNKFVIKLNLDVRRQKTVKVDGGYGGGKYNKIINNFAILCKYW